MPPVQTKAGFVYLIRLAEFTKIGCSRNPAKRLVSFQGLPWKPALLHCFPSEQPRLIEKMLHRRFRPVRVNGEWFSLTEEDVALIRTVSRADSLNDLPATLIPAGEDLEARSGENLNVWVISGLIELVREFGLGTSPRTTKTAVVEAALEEFFARRGIKLPSAEIGPSPPAET